MNGGFALVLDGSERVANIIKDAISWDVIGGVARRSWARNDHSMEVCLTYNQSSHGKGHITLPMIPSDDLIEQTVEKFFP